MDQGGTPPQAPEQDNRQQLQKPQQPVIPPDPWL